MIQNRDIHRFFHKKESAEDFLALRVKELGAELHSEDPRLLAIRTGAAFRAAESGSELHLKFWDRNVAISFPEFTGRDLEHGRPIDTFSMAMIAYNFRTADGTPEAGTWIAFSELPDGRFYTQAFQGYTGGELAKHFGDNIEAFTQAARSAGGKPEPMGDAGFVFRVLPKLSIMVTCWLGDEDFPSSYRILFDAAAGHQTTTDACAILGSGLTRRLIKAAPGGESS